MKKGKNNKGFSRIEVICITGIVSVVIFLVFMGIDWYGTRMKKGNDAMMETTAMRLASSDAMTGGCPVKNCGGDMCDHRDQDGRYVGYFDRPSNSIAAIPGEGYNEYKVMTIGEKTYYGRPGTMIIKVVCRNGEVTLSWVEGD